MIGHIAVTQLQFGPFPKDTLALIVSGGHTSLLHVEDMPRKIDVVGTTLDDAAGECFDKVARLLGFPYPGGPHIDRHGQNGDPHAIKVPMGLTQGKAGAAHPYDFSFSGVKTAVARWWKASRPPAMRFRWTTCAHPWPIPWPPCWPVRPCAAAGSTIPTR